MKYSAKGVIFLFLTIQGLNGQTPQGIARPYSYSYDVNDPFYGTQFGHSERADGSGVVSGRYHVLLPDGRLQTVMYTADALNGYSYCGVFRANPFSSQTVGAGHGLSSIATKVGIQPGPCPESWLPWAPPEWNKSYQKQGLFRS